MQADVEVAEAKRSLHAHLLELHQLIKGWNWAHMCLCHLNDGAKCLACSCKDAVVAIDKLLANQAGA
jgi:hypothetical protein